MDKEERFLMDTINTLESLKGVNIGGNRYLIDNDINKAISALKENVKLKRENKQLMARCYALTKGQICVLCPIEGCIDRSVQYMDSDKISEIENELDKDNDSED